ncbi:O-antigen ligase family protein [Salinibacter ruber]|uniref:O-antigen ligase family protein n=1 Tax=Salinibacter ruber TaxID=146919 RepID=UPI0021690A5E|nr:O-antigen ligase family protein [Salinibacter ruber]MCS4049236.1 O-antigen ligase [Salinibacter ruber]
MVPTDTFSTLRQFLSFGAFLAGASLLMVKLPFGIEDLFKSITIASVGYSLVAFFYIWNDPVLAISNPPQVKAGMRDYIVGWPQRYVVLLLLSQVYSLHKSYRNSIYLAPFIVLTACIFLTFSRAAYIGSIGGILFYFTGPRVLNILTLKRWSLSISKGVLYIITFIVGAWIMYATIEPVSKATDLITSRTYSPISAIVTGENITRGSARTRLNYWSEILEVVATNPITGTGFGGIYLFREFGSTHSQFMDILLRMGILGLLYYTYFYFKIMKQFLYDKPFLSAGMISWVLLGLFHETTTLPYGQFVFFSVLSITLDKKSKKDG